MNPYLFVLQKPAARWSFVVAFVARLPVAMTPLGLLILMEEEAASYAQGGIVAGSFALGHAVSAPFWGRALDAGSHGRVVARTAMLSSAFLAMSWLATELRSGLFPIACMALCAGFFFPPVTPSMRVAWRRLVAPGSLAAAYALDAVAVEALFVIGPLLVGGLSAVWPALSLIATCLLLGLGGVGYALTAAGGTRGAKAAARAGQRAHVSVMRQGVLLVCLVAVAMALGFGQMDVALTSTAQAVSTRGLVLGLMFAAVGLGSIAGGLLFGARQWSWPPHHLLTVSLAGFGLGLAATGIGLWLAIPPLLLLPILLVAGLFISPSLLLLQHMIDHAVPPERTAEGQAWLGAVMTAGGAAGMALGGVWADAGPLMAGFLAAAATLALGSITASVQRSNPISPEIQGQGFPECCRIAEGDLRGGEGGSTKRHWGSARGPRAAGPPLRSQTSRKGVLPRSRGADLPL
jgi:MFS family permease